MSDRIRACAIMRTIMLEEHYATPAFLRGPGRELAEKAKTAGGVAAGLVEDLLDLGTNRIAKMDETGIGMQVVSLTLLVSSNRRLEKP
jgi:uncharacterized protein